MPTILLPTAEIVREYRQHEHLFCFYEDGIRGLVRDTVLLSSGYPYEEFNGARRAKKNKPLSEDLIRKVQQDYDNSIELRFMQLSHRSDPWNTIGLIVELVDFSVTEMMRTFFMLQLYEVCASRWKWVGDDLSTHISFMEETYGAYEPDPGLQVRIARI